MDLLRGNASCEERKPLARSYDLSRLHPVCGAVVPSIAPGWTLTTWDGVRHRVASAYPAKAPVSQTGAVLTCEVAWRTWDNARFSPPGDVPTCLWCAAREA